ncbi:multicopper oxidase domain-containing protein [Alkalinema sp. FACHB-956]|nr:multicopper oxidase domain-containing protein [Alkalinema sp. FACHB-956]
MDPASKTVDIKQPLFNRRQLLQAGLLLGAAGGATIGLSQLWRSRGRSATVTIPPLPQEAMHHGSGISPLKILREFDYGTVTQENGRTVREFRVEAQTGELQLNKSTKFITWNLNGRVPGPTFRATEGDRIRVIFYNKAGHSHSLHFHGTHPAAMDGVKPVRNGNVFIYEFDAEPYGVHLYHCHVAPVTRHIGKGLYGMFIIDPPQPRPPADEMVLIMAGYDTNNDNKNELYAFNGLPHAYMHQPIPIQQNQLIRLYVLNLIEFDPVATFHLHANLFRVNPTGRLLEPSYETDVITMGTAERHILEFSFKETGKFMFHPHQDAIAEAGCMGYFDVISGLPS